MTLRLVETDECKLSDEEVIDRAIEALRRIEETDTPRYLRRAIEATVEALELYGTGGNAA